MPESSRNLMKFRQRRTWLYNGDLDTLRLHGYHCLSHGRPVNFGFYNTGFVMFLLNILVLTMLPYLSFSDILERERWHFHWDLLISIQTLVFHHLKVWRRVLWSLFGPMKDGMYICLCMCILEFMHFRLLILFD